MTNSAKLGDDCPLCGSKVVKVTDDKRSVICEKHHYLVNLDGPKGYAYEAPLFQRGGSA